MVLSFSVEDTEEIDEILTSLETSAREGGNFLGVRRGELGHDCVTRNGFRSRIDAEIPPDPLVVGPLRSLTSSLMACPGRDVTDDMDEIDVTESVRLAARYKIGVEGVELVPCRCLK